MMSLLWKYILMHKMNAFCSDCAWMRPATLHTLRYCTLLSLSFDSHDHIHMPLLKAVQDAQTNLAHLTVIQGACYFFLQGTHMTAPLLAFGRPVLRMFDFQLAKLRWRWGWPATRHAMDCHIGFMVLYYQVAHKNLPEFFVSCSHHRTCGSKNAFSMVMSVRWKNNLLVHFHVLRAIP
jgi:hypothetical protein